MLREAPPLIHPGRPRLAFLALAIAFAAMVPVSHAQEGTDADGDGWTVEAGDCDDTRESVHPGATEACTGGLDEDCDGATDAADSDCFPVCPDEDRDGYVTCNLCRAGPGKLCGDCDDRRQNVNPGENERCNNRDDD
jgi:hypothetical protein